MTTSELAKEVYSIVEAKVLSRPTPMEFEMAYQARLAMERIRFVIKLNERARPQSAEAFEASMQLLGALNCLESVDRHFQERSRRAQLPKANGKLSHLCDSTAESSHE